MKATVAPGRRQPMFAKSCSRSNWSWTPEPPMTMRVVGRRARRYTGASLLEVLVAVSLLATSLLGVAAGQLAALRDADAQARREHASWMVVSIAETMAVPELAATMLERSRASIEKRLPGARISLTDEASDIGTIIVHWARTPGVQVHASSAEAGPCGPAAQGEAAHCIAQPFAAGGA